MFLTATESRAKILRQSNAFNHPPPPPVAEAAVCSKAVVLLLLLIYCLMYLPLVRGVGVLCWSLFWYALLYVLSSVVIILTRKRELVDLLLLSFGCLVTVYVMWLFLTVTWVGLQCMIVVFPDRANLLFELGR